MDPEAKGKAALLAAVSALGISLGVSAASVALADESPKESRYATPGSQQIKLDTQHIKGESQQLKLDSQHIKGESQQLKLDSQHLKGESQQLKLDSQHVKGETQ